MNMLSLVQELQKTYNLLYPLRKLNEYEQKLVKKYHSDVCINFPEIATAYIEQDRKLREAVAALEKITETDPDDVIAQEALSSILPLNS